jgi:cytochrome c2
MGRKTSGPALGLIYGKKAGSDLYYDFYSDNLKTSSVIWTNRNLFYFL